MKAIVDGIAVSVISASGARTAAHMILLFLRNVFFLDCHTSMSREISSSLTA